MDDIIVVGGGIAGLVAANKAAGQGARVTLVEKSKRIGGRARSRTENDFVFNQGAHALYRKGTLARILEELDVRVTGKPGAARGVFISRGGDMVPMPTNVIRLLAHPWFSLRGRRQLVRFYGRALLGRMNGQPLGGELNCITDETARMFAHSLVRLSTYSAEAEKLIAGEAGAQVRRATGGVLYLDKGWQTIVDGLSLRAREHGVRILEGQPVRAVTASNDGVECVLEDGTRLTAQAGVLAAAPSDETAWLGIEHSLMPVRAACLDVALTELPEKNRIFLQDIAEPLYLSVHSDSADLGPGQVIHLVRYLKSDEKSGPETEKQLMSFLERFQPGFQEYLVQKRFLPEMIVAHDLPGNNAPVRIWTDKPLFRAGDWVEGEGMLSDRSAHTGAAAAAEALKAVKTVKAGM
ncbi:MAG: NAD(P)/FAD-dependent oxidoreductase [Spirochaetia bacterium]|nr:NAD(P)/FAD-dependent oxidoreductase [Spirochaetia bacterium]